MRLLLWNLWWSSDDWSNRWSAIESIVDTYHPDVALFTESPRPNDTTWCFTAAETINGHEIGVTVASRWSILDLCQMKMLEPGASPRSACIALIQEHDLVVAVGAIHLSWQAGAFAARRAELASLLACRLLKEADLCILGGDLNCLPGSRELEVLSDGGYRDCWEVAITREGPPETRPFDRWLRTHNAHRVQPRRTPDVFGRIDQIWARSGSRRLEVGSATVIPQGEATEALLSDHRPLVVELNFRRTNEQQDIKVT
jgi:endonuclease/exonuclease/phosphatase family metal-dependent hydrolase